MKKRYFMRIIMVCIAAIMILGGLGLGIHKAFAVSSFQLTHNTTLYNQPNFSSKNYGQLGPQTLSIITQQSDGWIEVSSWAGDKWICPSYHLIHSTTVYRQSNFSSSTHGHIRAQTLNVISGTSDGWLQIAGNRWIYPSYQLTHSTTVYDQSNFSSSSHGQIGAQTLNVISGTSDGWLQIAGNKWIYPSYQLTHSTTVYSQSNFNSSTYGQIGTQTLNVISGTSDGWLQIAGNKWVAPNLQHYTFGSDSAFSTNPNGENIYLGQLGLANHEHFVASTGGDDDFDSYFNKTGASQASYIYSYWFLSGMQKAPAGTSASNWGIQQAQLALKSYNDMKGDYGSKVRPVLFIDVDSASGGMKAYDYANNQVIYNAFVNYINQNGNGVKPGTYSSPGDWSIMMNNVSPSTPGAYWVADYPGSTSNLTTSNQNWVNFPGTTEKAEVWQYQETPDNDVAMNLP